MARARRKARDAAEATIPPDATLRYSPAGVEWSNDIDIHCDRDLPNSLFAASAWLDLEPLLRSLRRDHRGRWAIVADGNVVGAADVTTDVVPDPWQSLERRARGGPSVRDVLEARVLQRSDTVTSRPHALHDVVALERRLGGDELAAVTGDRPPRRLRLLRRFRWRHRITIALSGVDGAGKSTLQRQFTEQLTLAGIPCSTHWQRPGYDIGWLGPLARVVKRALGRQAEPGVRQIGMGDDPMPRSRQGAAGWAWTRIVIVDYLARATWFWIRNRDVVVLDRGAVDARVTLATAYGLRRGMTQGMLRRLARHADVSLYLEIDASTAQRRKPHDPIATHALVVQIEAYRSMLTEHPEVRIVDARQPVTALCRLLWSALVDGQQT